MRVADETRQMKSPLPCWKTVMLPPPRLVVARDVILPSTCVLGPVGQAAGAGAGVGVGAGAGSMLPCRTISCASTAWLVPAAGSQVPLTCTCRPKLTSVTLRPRLPSRMAVSPGRATTS